MVILLFYYVATSFLVFARIHLVYVSNENVRWSVTLLTVEQYEPYIQQYNERIRVNNQGKLTSRLV